MTWVVERSRSHFLTKDDDGWALWGVDQDTDEPLLTFPLDAAGESRAREAFAIRTRETRRVRWLAFVAVVAGAIWVVINTYAVLYERLYVPRTMYLDVPTGESSLEFRLWLQTLGSIAYALFTVAVGLFVVAWLLRRWRREG